MDIIIRQATLRDKDAIFEFIKSAYDGEQPGSSQFKIPDRWIWQFEKNPFINKSDNKLPIWLALDKNKIVGQYCAIQEEMRIGSEIYNMGWGCDLIVNPDYRGLGIAFKLHTAFNNYFPFTAAITFAIATRRIWENSGSISLSKVSIYWYVFKLDKNFVYFYIKRRILHRKKLLKVMNFLFKYLFINLFLAILVNSIIILKKTYNFQLKYKIKSEIIEVFEFDNIFDNFINKITKEESFIVPRNSKILNWKFFQNNQFNYKVFIAKKNDEIKGYIVLRNPHPAELKIGSIVDFYVSKNDIDTIYDLLELAINYFKDTVSAIQCLTSVKEFEDLLHKIGFIVIKNFNPLVSISNPSLREKLKNKLTQCYITLADHDLDQVETI